MKKFDFGNDYVSRYKLDHPENVENKAESETEGEGTGDNKREASEATDAKPASPSETTGEKPADKEEAKVDSVHSDTAGGFSKKKRPSGVRGHSGSKKK